LLAILKERKKGGRRRGDKPVKRARSKFRRLDPYQKSKACDAAREEHRTVIRAFNTRSDEVWEKGNRPASKSRGGRENAPRVEGESGSPGEELKETPRLRRQSVRRRQDIE